ncbi:MAG: MFS transporter [Reyranella sp.]|jgi:DHA3 family macrolide efflux protein-like MFS transporter|uniref:MFS transporter n=1 Tax=Reyranella sp. TaxID=1929291 RepID=UPI0025DDCDE8|nr:MFS transporter [Reyranella sp.]MBR2820103.1 MFS transporter [Reyranella sp.]
MIPVFRPLKDRAVQIVWSGLCTSTIGEDLFRVASVWLAVEVAGNMAGLVTGVQYVAMLVAGLFGAVIFDRWRPDRAMIGSRAWSAAFAFLPVVGYYVSGISITLLILSSVGLAALRMVFSPALQSTIPTLVPNRDEQQAINGLFDATYRIARLLGPMVAALLHLFLPVIHFLSATAIGFIISGIALHMARHRLTGGGLADPVRMAPGWRGAWDALTAGFRLMVRERVIGTVLVVNAVMNGPWMVALSLAIALIVTEYRPTFLGFGDLAAYALVMGAYGVGDVSGNIIAGSVRFRRPLSTMFLGYVAMGGGFSFLALAVWFLPAEALLPAMMLGALVAGVGGPFFFVPMITRMQTVFHGHDIARVFRLRLVVMAAAMLVSSLVATWFFEVMGAVATQLACGLLILAVGGIGYGLCRRLENRPVPVASSPDSTGE